jgi:porphobilinogen synthase
MHIRMRRNRQNPVLRSLMSETILLPEHMIYPVFIMEGQNKVEPISAMPGQFRWTLDKLIPFLEEVAKLGVKSFALFPKIDESLKDSFGKESYNKSGLVPRAISEIKARHPDWVLITDVALDPYNTDGHDGIVSNSGTILNDATIEVLCKQAIVQAEAGADMVAPSDMMDGRVGLIRSALDSAGFDQTLIMAYSAKYASGYYGPFRTALDSAPKFGDKKTYQMDPANSNEALHEVALDLEEGADWIIVKPALSYLDIIQRVKSEFKTPLAAYNVSGEYAMIMAAAEKGWIDGDRVMLETLLSMRRAGADAILTYFAPSAAKLLVG